MSPFLDLKEFHIIVYVGSADTRKVKPHYFEVPCMGHENKFKITGF